MNMQFYNYTGYSFFYMYIVALFVSCNVPRQAAKPEMVVQNHRSNPYPLIPAKDFTGVWEGVTTCKNDAEQLHSAIHIMLTDSNQLFIVDQANTTDTLIGNVRGYVVIAEKHKVKPTIPERNMDWHFVLTNDRQTLMGYFNRSGREADTCITTYHHNYPK